MSHIISNIEKESKKLENTKLCTWLSSTNNPYEDRFNFVPSMLFFVLGFKDILDAMEVKNPISSFDHEINTHCKEDTDHWKWYISDLSKLGINIQSWGGDIEEMLRNLWSDDSRCTRDLVYTTIYYVKHYNNPIVSLIIIEQLEAAFGVFIKHMSKPIQSERVYNQLTYFGKTHIEKEESHTRGAWIEGERRMLQENFHNIKLDEGTFNEMQEMISNLSKKLIETFEHWYQSRNDYVRFIPAIAPTDDDSRIEHKDEEVVI